MQNIDYTNSIIQLRFTIDKKLSTTKKSSS